MTLERRTGGTNVISEVLAGDTTRRRPRGINAAELTSHTVHRAALYAPALQNVEVTFLKMQSEGIKLEIRPVKKKLHTH